MSLCDLSDLTRWRCSHGSQEHNKAQGEEEDYCGELVEAANSQDDIYGGEDSDQVYFEEFCCKLYTEELGDKL